MPRLTGAEAITYAALTATQLDSYTPPVAQPRDDLTIDEAEKVVGEDGGFVWTDTDRQSDAQLDALDVSKALQQLIDSGHPQDRGTVERMLAAARERGK